MRDNCTEPRDLAMIDMLASTGMRVGEMVLLNRNDIDFNERECIVFGKGNKERVVYFDARTKIHLQNYLNSRQLGTFCIAESTARKAENWRYRNKTQRIWKAIRAAQGTSAQV